MKNYLIIVPEEFSVTNHKELFFEIAKSVEGQARVIVVDIPADAIVTRIRHKTIRLKESRKKAEKLADNMYRIRPFFIIRPELMPMSVLPLFSKAFWKKVKESFPGIMDEEVKVLCYNRTWFPILVNSHKKIELAYYVTDEWRKVADTDKTDNNAVKFDDFACKHSKAVFVASPKIKQTREHLNNSIYVTGNGATYRDEEDVKPFRKFNNSVGFIGHFRDWIDIELLRGIISSKKDVFFAFLGKVQPEMESELQKILNDYGNTAYFGKVKKEDVSKTYKMFNCIIIPYIQNEFMQNTRPIKIVESVFAGTPVVSIPVGGHCEHSFIRFATDVKTFGEQIDYLLNNPIDKTSDEYRTFIKDNSWESIAHTILATL